MPTKISINRKSKTDFIPYTKMFSIPYKKPSNIQTHINDVKDKNNKMKCIGKNI